MEVRVLSWASRDPGSNRFTGGNLARRSILLAAAILGCATATKPKPWRPEPGPELRAACRQAPVTCRETAQGLASSWTTDEEAFGALKTFSAACDAGDTPSCDAIDRRFTPPRYLGERPAPHYTEEARKKRVQGTWAAICTFTRTGEVPGCSIQESLAGVDTAFVAWIKAGPWAPATLDQRPFGCDHRIEFVLKIGEQ